MKKLLLITICLLSIILVLTSCGKKSDAPEFNYKLKDDGTYAVSIAEGATDKKLTIPSSYQGVAVTEICGDGRVLVPATSITIPDSITTIGEYAFSYCYNLKKISIPDSVTSIGDYAFYSCAKLKSIDISDGVTSIGDSVFDFCVKLKNVNIPSSLTSIGDSSFEWNSKLKFNEYNNAYYLGNKDNPYMLLVGATSSNIDFVIIHKDTKLIGSSAFHYCSNLTSVIIPDGVIHIGESAFSGCGKLKNVLIPNSVTSIDGSTFHRCSSIESIVLPDTITAISDHMFYGCSSLKSVTIPNSVTSIGDYAFSHCSKLESIIIPDSVTSFGDSAFVACSSLKFNEYGNICYLGNDENPYMIFIGVTDTSLTSYTVHKDTNFGYSPSFYECKNLTAIYVDEGNETYESIEGNLYIKKENKLVQYAIGKLDSSFTIPNGTAIVGYAAFDNCKNLTSVIIPDSVTEIHDSAFYGCENLEKITIGNGVTSIGSSAFDKCGKLKGVYITDVAAWCRISFESSNSNPLYYANNLYVDGELIKDLVIPHGVTSIGYKAFSNCSSITSVTIPSTIESVGDYAFSGCSALTTVNLGSGITTISKSMFRNCLNLADITIPSSVTSIGYGAFEGCSSLPYIIIPESVTYIGKYAFSCCNELKAAIFENPDDWGYMVPWGSTYLTYYYSYDGIVQYSYEELESNDLVHPSTAAQLLTAGHHSQEWYQGHEKTSDIKFSIMIAKTWVRKYIFRQKIPQ